MSSYGICLMVHEDLEDVTALIEYFSGNKVPTVVHVDRHSSRLFKVLSSQFGSHGFVRIISEVHCEWGDWSLVEAELATYETFLREFEDTSYVHLMSASDRPIRRHSELSDYLSCQTSDFIQIVDIEKESFVVGGIESERLAYYYPFNFVRQRFLFELTTRVQKLLRIKKRLPIKAKTCMGGQFKTLRLSTVKAIFEFVETNGRVVNFFKSSWIPDESFLPTVVNYLSPKEKVTVAPPLTQVNFNMHGRPVVFYADNLHLLDPDRYWFARKFASGESTNIDVLQSTLEKESKNQVDFSRYSPAKQHRHKHNNFYVVDTSKKIDSSDVLLENTDSTRFTFVGPIDAPSDTSAVRLNDLDIDEELYLIWENFKHTNVYSYLANINAVSANNPLYSISAQSLLSGKYQSLLDMKANRFIISNDISAIRKYKLQQLIELSSSELVPNLTQ